MLNRTFRHIPGVGSRTEQALWRRGAVDWASFLASPGSFGLAPGVLVRGIDVVSRSTRALEREDARFFAERLATAEHWRAFRAFRHVCYVDIETDGGTDFDSVTVIGIAGSEGLRQYVRGEDLLEAEEALAVAQMLVTFSGSRFDVPVLRRLFPRLRLDGLHFDLCLAFRRLGVPGGLKALEAQMGIQRSRETQGLAGFDAVNLWRQWQLGSEEARRILLQYNAEDVRHLQPLAEIAYRGLRERLESCARRE